MLNQKGIMEFRIVNYTGFQNHSTTATALIESIVKIGKSKRTFLYLDISLEDDLKNQLSPGDRIAISFLRHLTHL